MAKDINFGGLCEELCTSLKSKGCGMTPVQRAEGGFNDEFMHIVLKSINESRK